MIFARATAGTDGICTRFPIPWADERRVLEGHGPQ